MILAMLVLAIVLTAVAERFDLLRVRAQPFWRAHSGTDVVYLLTGYVGGAALALAYVANASGMLGTQLGLPRLADADLPSWLTLPLALVTLDAGNYFTHWLMHRVDVLWELHKVHHSIPQFDWLSSFRFHILEQAIRRLVGPLLLILIGFPIGTVALAAGLFTAWAIVNHSNLNFGPRWLEWLVVTPRLHRMHHMPETTEQNLGAILTLWDRLRGTFVTGSDGNRDVLGVPGEVDSYPQSWGKQLVQPLRAVMAVVVTEPSRL